MATAITSNFTFNQIELDDLSKVTHEQVYDNPTLTDLHDVQTGVKFDTQIVFSAKRGLMGKAINGCDVTAIGGINLTEKTWQPKMFGFKLEHCHGDVNAQDKLLNMWAKSKDFANVIDGAQSAVGAFVVGSILEAMPEDILVKAWFSQIGAATFANGGNFKNGTDLGFVNTINGLFKQIFTEIATPTVAIAKNAGTTYVNQELAPGDAFNIFRNLYNKADSRILNDTESVYYVTRSLYDGLYNDKEDKQFANGILEIVDNGIPTLTYRGKRIVKCEFWDRYIKILHDNGTKLERPHRALLTSKYNIPVATMDTDSLTSLNAWYSIDDNVNRIRATYNLDAKLLQKDLMAVAY